MSRPLWPPLLQTSSGALPKDCEVAVIGASLPGLYCALRLAQGGARVLLLESEPSLGEGSVGRGNGLVHLGVGEHPIQLVEAIGHADAQAFIQLSLRSIELLRQYSKWTSEGGIWAASMDREDKGIARSSAWLTEIGVACEDLHGRALDEHLGQAAFSMGRLHLQEGTLQPRELIRHLAELAIGAGAVLRLGHEVVSADREGDWIVLRGPSGTCRAEVVLFAGGWKCSKVESFFEEKVFPVRAQHLWEEGESGIKVGGRTQHGYVSWAPAAKGLLVSGCRWASPHMEVGETVEKINPRVGSQLDRFRTRFGRKENAQRFEWTSIMDFSCDGLPVLGPLPGQARKIACAGFSGQDLGLALACGELLCEGILNASAASIPRRLHAGRFV